MRKRAVIPGWASVVAAALVLAGCATTSSGANPVPDDPVVSDDAVVSATAVQLDTLERWITGDLAEKRASEVLNYHRVVGGTAACMHQAGHPYRVPPFVSSYLGFTDADLGYGTGRATVFDSLTGGTRIVVLNALTQSRQERAGLTAPDVAAADVAAYETCAAPFDHRSYYDVDPPDGAYQLAAFTDLLTPVQSDPAVAAAMAPYQRCMKQRYGYDVPDRDDFLSVDRLHSADAPADGAAATPAWTSELAALTAALAADVDCRRPAYRIAMRLLAPRLAPWQAEHRAQLDTIRAEWRRRVAAAAFVPSPSTTMTR